VKKRPERGIELAEMDTPRISRDQLLVRVKACGICGSDVHIYEWTPSYSWLTKLMPIVPGHEFAGEIVEKGQDCVELNVGQRVTCMPFVPCGICEFCQKGRPMICESMFGGDGIVGLHHNGALAEFVAVPEASAFFYRRTSHSSLEHWPSLSRSQPTLWSAQAWRSEAKR